MGVFTPFSSGFRFGSGSSLNQKLALLLTGQAGGIFDPADPATRFQDQHALTMSGDGDPVSVLLDKSQRLGFGTEKVLNPGGPFTATTHWATEIYATVTVEDGLLKCTNTQNTSKHVYTDLTTVAGEIVDIFAVLKATQAIGLYAYQGSYTALLTSKLDIMTDGEWQYCRLRARATTTQTRISFGPGVATSTWYIRSLSARTLKGHHGIQTVSAARPTLTVDAQGYSYLSFDQVDDAMAPVFPDFGADATLSYNDGTSIVQSTGQTISGATAFPAVERIYGLVVTENALTADELATIERWLQMRKPV